MTANDDQPVSNPSTTSDIEAAILAANTAFYSAFNDHDLEAMAALWSSSPELTCVHPGWNVLRGREAVIESWRAILGNPQQPKIVGAAERAQLLGNVGPNTTALVVGRELVGGSPIAVTNVFVREGAAWKLLHHHASPIAGL